MKYMKLSEEEKLIIKNNFNRITLRQIMKLMPRWTNYYNNFKRHVSRMGMKRDRTQNRLPISVFYNQDYWRNLNLINCYFAGHIAADGCIKVNNKNQYSFSVDISAADKSIIDNYVKEFNYSGKIYRTERKTSISSRISKFVSITMTCFDQNAKKLKEHFNLEPNKTKRLRPTNISNKYLNFAYLMGLIDGDGHIYLSKSSTGRTNIIIGYSSCSKDIVEWVKDLVDLNFKSLISCQPSKLLIVNNCYRYSFSGIRAAAFINYLRKFPLEDYRLARKWDNPEVLAYIAEKKAQYSEYFIEPDAAELAALMPRKEEYQLPPQISLPPL